MLTILERTDSDILGVEVTQRLTHEDYQTLTPHIEKIIEQYGYLNFLVILNRFEGWQAHAALDDFKFGFKYYNDIKKLAVVGDQIWGAWLQKIAAFFVKEEVKYFLTEQLNEAWQWIEHKPVLTKYKCTICGFIYDEQQGFAERNIAPGTQWSDLPDHWACPDCKDEKANFVAVEEGGNGLIEPLRR